MMSQKSYTSGISDTPLLGMTIGDLFDQTYRMGNDRVPVGLFLMYSVAPIDLQSGSNAEREEMISCDGETYSVPFDEIVETRKWAVSMQQKQ
jgi:hypothetical protein